MAKPVSHNLPSWLTVGSFDVTEPAGMDLPRDPIDLDSVSASQLFANVDYVSEQSGPLLQDFNSNPTPPYAQLEEAKGIASLPFFADATRFSNPPANQIVTLDIQNHRNSVNGCGTGNVPSSSLSTDRFGTERAKESMEISTNMFVDSIAAQFCEFWLRLYPEVFPKEADIHALGQLTRQPPASIEKWLNSKIRCPSSSSHDSGIGSSCSSTVSCVVSSQGGVPEGSRSGVRFATSQISGGPNKVSLAEVVSPQMLQRDPKYPESDRGMVPVPANGGAQLMVAVPVAWSTSPLVSASLEKAAWSSRARSSCHPVLKISCLRRNPDKPLQCTRKCGYATAAKKDWKRHESNSFPQHGFLCTVPATIRIGDDIFCSYCPVERLQSNPTVKHMESVHGLTFESECNMEVDICNKVRHRKQRMETHFRKIHPGVDLDAWVNIGAFAVKHSAFPKHCGFCRKVFTS
jgi:hypothetical protein